MKTRPSDYLGTIQLLTQLAEEAAELASVASKLVRVIDGENPSPVPFETAHYNLLEESADVQNILGELLNLDDWEKVAVIKKQKMERWMGRLEQRREHGKWAVVNRGENR